LVTRLALDENLLARSRILGIPRNDCEDSGSEHENQTAHPTFSMTDKEHAHANRSGYFVNRLRSRINSIAQKGLLAKPDLKSRWLFMSTLLAD
jgi:beta-xylosidase